MSDNRAYHACARIKRSGRDYIMAASGLYGVNRSWTDTIEFYDLTLMPSTWEFLPGMSMPGCGGTIYGGIVTKFDEGICEAFFINNAHGCVCSGNYSWTSGPLTQFRGGFLYFPVIDANLVGGDTVW